MLNVSFDMGVVPMDYRGACIVPQYKGNGDKCECSNSRGISLLSVVISGTEWAIGEEKRGFWQGRGCKDQVFAVRQVGV